MIEATQLAGTVGTSVACQALGVARATLYRHRAPAKTEARRRSVSVPARALAQEERVAVLNELHSERFVDKAPAEVYATLLDEGTYLCSIRTMYRILAGQAEVRERRDQLRHPKRKAPELVATGPNQVWSWDITKLRGPAKWIVYYLYVILDIFSRYAVGWMVAQRESSTLAARLIGETCEKQGIKRGQLKLHADLGAPMKSQSVSMLLAELSVTRSHGRPRVSNDNPFSESQFKTLKYQPDFPERFGSVQHALSFCRRFFPWYNNEHRHSGIALLTPASVHYGTAGLILQKRREVLAEACLAHPERFVRSSPRPLPLPEQVWINRPERCLEGGDLYTKFVNGVSQNASHVP
jgi:putative transposase